MHAEERDAWLRLTLTPGLTPGLSRAILAEFGLPTKLFSGSVPVSRLARLGGEGLAATLLGEPSPRLSQSLDQARAWLDRSSDHWLLCMADPDYPRALLSLGDPPIVLYAAGRRELLAHPAMAIVGSRSATRQGEQNAAAFAAHLGAAGFCVISGMARGIDAAAHRGALASGPGTIGVLGTGIDIVYPPGNRELAQQVARSGLLLSEYALGVPALAANFPRRNRLIAALARGVLVVEATVRSGSLITARLAAELGREVFAIPGSIHSPLSKGCHRLIRDGAKLVESAQDVLEELQPDRTSRQARGATAPGATDPDAPSEPWALLAALGHDPVDIDTIAARSGREAGAVTAALFDLELAGRVERLPGNRYQRLG